MAREVCGEQFQATRYKNRPTKRKTVEIIEISISDCVNQKREASTYLSFCFQSHKRTQYQRQPLKEYV